MIDNPDQGATGSRKEITSYVPGRRTRVGIGFLVWSSNPGESRARFHRGDPRRVLALEGESSTSTQ